MEDSTDRWLLALGTPGAAAALAGFGRRDGGAASWWDWHLLMAAAFGTVAFTALRERRGGDPFAALYLDETLGRIDKLRERFGRLSRRSWRRLRAEPAIERRLEPSRCEVDVKGTTEPVTAYVLSGLG